MAKASSADDYKLSSSFEELRKTLSDNKFTDRRGKPLAYWALPNDRRLPLAFLGRTLGNLLETPYTELASTAGIGQKKISSLVKLLHRATRDEPPAVPFGIDNFSDAGEAEGDGQLVKTRNFDPSLVSEALWSQWRETVCTNGVGDEKLGRLAPTLQSLPTVIWNTPLSEYVNYSVTEIRQLKTHGEKRVRVVLEVFYLVHELITSADQQHLDVRLVPKFIPPIEDWIASVLERRVIPASDEVNNRLAQPMLAQIETDAGPTVAQLAADRIGIDTTPRSVRMQSRKMGVTRARVYQLLDDCSKIMAVRWIDGERHLSKLATLFQETGTGNEDLQLFRAIGELFYPSKYTPLQDETQTRIETG